MKADIRALVRAVATCAVVLSGPTLTTTAEATAAEPGAAETCYPDWSTAAPIVRREGLVTVEQLSTLIRDRERGDIVKASLCEARDGYAFRIVVRNANGQLKSLLLDARKPFGP